MSKLAKKLIAIAINNYPIGGASYRGVLSEEDRAEIEKECRIACNHIRMNGSGEYTIHWLGGESK